MTSPFNTGPQSDLTAPVRTFRTLLLLAQRLRYLMDDRLRTDGLTTQQAALLTAVIALDGPALGDAAAALHTTHQNAAQLVAALQRKGLLRVEPDPADRRRKRLIATDANASFWRERDDGDRDAVAEWFSVLTAEELQTLYSLADRVLANLNPSQ